MGLDIRLPIGIIFTFYGILLLVYGALANPEIFQSSLGVNIDKWWGAAMLVFGLGMGALAFRASRRAALRRPQGSGGPAPPPPSRDGPPPVGGLGGAGFVPGSGPQGGAPGRTQP
jgi:hypothetical protein